MARAEDTVTRSRGGRTRAWLGRLVIAVVAVELLYVVAANIFLQTGVLDRLINKRPERMRISWDSAVTYFPGVVLVHGFELRNQSRADQIFIKVDRAHAVISLIKLPTRTLHVRNVNARDVDFRLRNRFDAPKLLERDATSPPAGAEYYPEIPGWSNPPAPKPEEIYTPKKRRPKPWTIKITGMNIRSPIRAAINQLSVEGNGRVGGGMTLKPRQSVTIHRARLKLAPLRVTIGPDLLTEDLDLSLAVRGKPFALPKPKVQDIVGGLSGSATVSGRLGNRAAIERRIAPGITARGSGAIDAAWKLKRGVVQAGSSMSLESERFEVTLMGLRFVGSATVRSKTSKEKGDAFTTAHIALPDYRLEDANDRSIDAKGRDLAIDVVWQGFELAGPEPPSSITVALPSTEIRDISALNELLPRQVPLALTSGTGTLTANLEIGADTKAVGDLQLDAEDVMLTTRETVHRADLEIRATLAEGDLEARRFDLSGTTVQVDDLGDEQLTEKQQQRLERWYCKIRVERGGITFGKPVSVAGSFTVTMFDIRPVFALLREIGKPPRWLFVVPNIKNIDGRFGLDLAARSLALDDVEISGQGLEVLGWMHKRVGQKNNGRFFVKYKALAAGLGQKDGKSSVHLANPRRWFDEQPRSGPSQ